MNGQSFTMYIERPMSYHERLFRKAGHTTEDIDKLVADLVTKGFVKQGDPYGREAACVIEMAKLGARHYLDY